MGVTCLYCSLQCCHELCKGRSVLAAAAFVPAGHEPVLIRRLCRFIRLSEAPVILVWQQLIWVWVCWHPPYLACQQQKCSSVGKTWPRRPQCSVSDLVQARGHVLLCFQQRGRDGAAHGTEARFSFYFEKFLFCGGYRSNRLAWCEPCSDLYTRVSLNQEYSIFTDGSALLWPVLSPSLSVLFKQMLSWWYLTSANGELLS